MDPFAHNEKGMNYLQKNIAVIELLDSDSEDEGAASASAASSSKRSASATTATAAAENGLKRSKSAVYESDSDDSVEIVEGGSDWRYAAASAAGGNKENDPSSGNAPNAAGTAAGSAQAARGKPKDDRNYGEEKGEDSDDEIALVATKGQNALVDFPHSRENCVTHPFSGRKEDHCPNCYCYCCDTPATACKLWATHCKASHGNAYWRNERERVKRLGGADAAAAAARAASSSSSSSSTAARAASSSSSSSSSTAAPRLWGGPNLVARSSSNANADSYADRPNLPQYSIKALLDKLTVVHPVEATPPRGVFATDLRHYQKQSLAFMLEVERSTDPPPFGRTLSGGPATRGGWLCDEVGMGKSAVVLALVASEPMAAGQVPTAQAAAAKLGSMRAAKARFAMANQNYRHQKALHEARQPGVPFWLEEPRRPAQGERMKLKGTVILTSVSLLGQWEDECRKHAPGLKVIRYHNLSSQKKKKTFEDALPTADVILSTSTFQWDRDICSAFSFHRVAQDESHLFGKGNSANPYHANLIVSGRRWCVTATPCTSAVGELRGQAVFLGGFRPNIPLHASKLDKQAFYRVLDGLKPVLVRHTKAQRIGGSRALALPPSSSSTIMVSMDANELARKNHVIQPHLVAKYRNRTERAITVSRAIGTMSGFGCASKIAALRTDLEQLRRREPSLRAVIFTQYRETHSQLLHEMRRGGVFDVFEFSGSTSASGRDRMIRQFQSSDSQRPAVFVITIRAGSVGVTLTAASRVYLMEPCLDPAIEVQAAGRIHRLGQQKAVHVKKFAFRDSPEENIIELHREIAAGRIALTDGLVPPAAFAILARGL